MSYKHAVVLILALLIDISIGIFFVNLGPLFLVATIFYFALQFDYFDLLIAAFIAGFLYDLSLMSQSVFYTIFFIALALLTKILGRKIIHFSNRFVQMLTIITFLVFRMLYFYLMYDRSINSIFLIHNLIALVVAIIIFLVANFVLRLYAKKN